MTNADTKIGIFLSLQLYLPTVPTYVTYILGKELFQTDKSLNDSDIKFLANTGDVAISVDESLFEVRRLAYVLSAGNN